jgi:hypothetical protein
MDRGCEPDTLSRIAHTSGGMKDGQPYDLIPFITNDDIILGHFTVCGYARFLEADIKHIRLGVS